MLALAQVMKYSTIAAIVQSLVRFSAVPVVTGSISHEGGIEKMEPA